MYEIYQREKGQHRVGHVSFRIGGLESEMTIEPAQYMPKALAEALAAGHKPGEDAAAAAMDICVAMARKVAQRKVDKLRRGFQPGGLALGGEKLFKSGGIEGLTASQLASLNVSEGNALEGFLNRGRLRGLTRAERDEVHAQRAQHRERDQHAEWLERRKAIYEDRTAKLKAAEVTLAALTRQPGEVPADFEGRQAKLEKRIRLLKSEIDGLKGPFAATHGFQYAYTQYLTKQVSLSVDDIRIWLCMTNTTADTVRDAVDTWSDVTIDEFDGANYSAGGLALDSQAVAVDDANDRAEFDAADEVVTALGAGTRPIEGYGLGSFVTNTASSLPLHWLEASSNPTPDGSDFTLVFNAEGILQAADG